MSGRGPLSGLPGWLVADLGLALLALALRLPGLDGQLWLDEISALRGYRRSFLETLTVFPPFFPNPLYELLAHASILGLGESAWAIRLPAALFGVAGVVVFHHLARLRLAAGEALFAVALLAFSYHHVFYSQDARGYTAWLALTLLAAALGLRWLADLRARRRMLAWAGAATLAAYAHPFGLFVLAGQAAVVSGIAATRGGAALRRALGGVAAASVATLVLYAPLVPSALDYVASEARAPSHGPRVTGLLPELLEGLAPALGGPLGLGLAAVLLAAGGLIALRRMPILLALLAVPLALSAATILALGAGVHPRYFLPALPLAMLLATCGLAWLGRTLVRGLPLAPARHRTLLALGAVLLLLGYAMPLRGYYALPKQDYLGALRFAAAQARPGDVVVAADLAGRAVTGWYDPSVPLVDDLPALAAIERGARRVFVLTTLERPMESRAPALLAYLHTRYERRALFPGTVGDGALRVYLSPADSSEASEAGSAKATR